VVVASAWFAAAMAWGLFGPLAGAHAAADAARGIAAENMTTWDIWGPVTEYVATRPPPQLYDTEHPWGTFWIVRGLVKILGHHDFVPRLQPFLMSVVTPPLLYAIGRALWGPGPGALAALAYVVVPVTLALGSSAGFDVALVFGCLLATWGYVRFAERWRRRWLAVSLLGVACTANADWSGCVFLAAVLLWFVLAHYLAPRWFGRVPALRFGRWWAFSAAIVSVTLAAYLYFIFHNDLVDRVLSQVIAHEKGHEAPLRELLKQRSASTSLALTPVVMAVGRLAVPVFVFRLVLLRQAREVFPLALLAMASLTYVHFPGGPDASSAALLPFAAYGALSLGVLATAWVGVGRWMLRRLGRRDERQALPAVAFAGLAVVPLVVLPDGVRGLAYGRVAGGLFDAPGQRLSGDPDRAAALAWMSERMKLGTRVQVHSSAHATRADEWVLRRPVTPTDGLPVHANRADDRYYVGDLAFIADRGPLATQFHLVAVGTFVFVDRTAPTGPADGYALDVRAPDALEWAFVSGAAPVVTVRADPWYTWELRDELGQTPNPPPAAEPVTPEELRVAHNIAVAAGDGARADAFEAKLVEKLLVYPAATFTDGTRLLGVRVTPGFAPTLEVYLAAAGPSRDGAEFEIETSIRSGPRLSLVAADDAPTVLRPPLLVSPRAWRRGYIYASRSRVGPRPGSEVVSGYFTGLDKGRTPRPRDGSTKIRLLTID